MTSGCEGRARCSYVWDPFGRLRFVLNQDDALIAEYRYNGLGYRIAVPEDTDTDGDVDGDDDWFYSVFDERWREVTRFQEGETNPPEEFVYHAAGFDGLGSSSYIDLVVLRDRDTDTNGTFDERHFICQNWRADVSAIVTAGGAMVEWVKYSAYGIPFGLPRGDANSDGDSDSTDVSIVGGWSGISYDVRGDLNLDGVVDASDEALMAALNGGWEVLSPSGVGHAKGYSGYGLTTNIGVWHSRKRLLAPAFGRWITRDPALYVSGENLYAYAASSPIITVDPTGMVGESVACGAFRTRVSTLTRSFDVYDSSPSLDEHQEKATELFYNSLREEAQGVFQCATCPHTGSRCASWGWFTHLSGICWPTAGFENVEEIRIRFRLFRVIPAGGITLRPMTTLPPRLGHGRNIWYSVWTCSGAAHLFYGCDQCGDPDGPTGGGTSGGPPAPPPALTPPPAPPSWGRRPVISPDRPPGTPPGHGPGSSDTPPPGPGSSGVGPGAPRTGGGKPPTMVPG